MVRFIAFGLGLSALVTVTAACSSSDTTTATEQVVVKPTCPAFVDQAVNSKSSMSKCNTEGYVCGIGYPCGSFQQQATCTCTGGKYACVSADGKEIQADTSSADVSANFCIPQPPSPEACPMDVTAAGKQCQTAGKTCYYKGLTCSNGNQLTDNCYCEGSVQTLKDGGTVNRLTWNCTIDACK